MLVESVGLDTWMMHLLILFLFRIDQGLCRGCVSRILKIIPQLVCNHYVIMAKLYFISTQKYSTVNFLAWLARYAGQYKEAYT